MSSALILLVGQQGTGKTTLGYRLGDAGLADFLSAGVLLRSEARQDTDLGALIRRANRKAEGVPPQVSYGLLREHLAEFDSSRPIVLDGFPREAVEYEFLQDAVGRLPDVVLALEAPTVVTTARLLTRTNCSECGRPYGVHEAVAAPEEGCLSCGGDLERRDDDSGAGVAKRHRHWRRHGPEVLACFADRVRRLDATATPQDVEVAAREALRSALR